MTETLTTNSARADLAALTETRIMRGAAAFLAAGSGDFTFRALAETSGVPERTIYRHYPTKEAVFTAFWTWLNAHLAMPAAPRSPDELVDQVADLFAAFARGEPLVRAMLHDAHGRATRLAHAEARRERVRRALEGILAKLSPAEGRRLLASVQVLFSATGWEAFRDQWGMTNEEAADTAAWAIRGLIAQAQVPSAKRRASTATKRRKG